MSYSGFAQQCFDGTLETIEEDPDCVNRVWQAG